MALTTFFAFLHISPAFLKHLQHTESSVSAYGSCAACNPHDGLCEKWGSQVILRSRAYEGSGTQMRPFLGKVMRGEDVVVVIIGGSWSGDYMGFIGSFLTEFLV